MCIVAITSCALTVCSNLAGKCCEPYEDAEMVYHGRHSAPPEAHDALRLHNAANDLSGCAVGVLFALQACLHKIDWVGGEGRNAAADGSCRNVAQKGGMVLVGPDERLCGPIAPQPHPCAGATASDLLTA